MLLVSTDVRDACDILRPVYDFTDGADGYVSLEVSPHLAHDSEGSIAEARRLWAVVDRPNLMIKIPGTAACLPAIEQLLYEGINVNITLLFSVQRYKAVMQAWLQALDRRLTEGRPVRRTASVASFFLSRIDILVDELLDQRIGPEGNSPFTPHPGTLQGKVAVANARQAYAVLSKMLKGDSRWQRLSEAGIRPQRLLWASTSTKNPNYDDLMYVEPLIGPHTINTMTLKTIAAFADHGKVARTVDKEVRAASHTLRDLRALGIDLEQVATQLENEGIRKFIQPYETLLQSIERKREHFVAKAAQGFAQGSEGSGRGDEGAARV